MYDILNHSMPTCRLLPVLATHGLRTSRPTLTRTQGASTFFCTILFDVSGRSSVLHSFSSHSILIALRYDAVCLVVYLSVFFLRGTRLLWGLNTCMSTELRVLGSSWGADGGADSAHTSLQHSRATASSQLCRSSPCLESICSNQLVAYSLVDECVSTFVHIRWS